MSQNETVRPKGQKHTKLMLVRYGRMGGLGWFEHHEDHIPRLSTHVVIKTERGLELGQVVGAHNYRGGQFKSSPEQVEAYYVNRTKDFPLCEGGTFVRFATHEDIREQEHLEKSAVGEAKCAQKFAEQLNLQMKIIEAEHLFGGERIIFYFTSEGRVDFRELVKQLAREYQTRIELRQIGSRDEARLISDYETCGQQCCCSRYLKILEPVNMRMAKLQKATLDPSKISGHCGRLKCCLRYEDGTYMELKGKLPRKNSMVQTPKGTGKVVDMHILTQLVVVQNELGDRKAWPVDELRPYRERGGSDQQNQTSETPAAEFKGRPRANTQAPVVDAEAISAQLEDMVQIEHTLESDKKKGSSDRQKQPPRQRLQHNQNKTNNKDASSNQKDGNTSKGNAKNRQGGRRNRRRKPKNKNRNNNRNNEGRPKKDNQPKNQSKKNKPAQSGE